MCMQLLFCGILLIVVALLFVRTINLKINCIIIWMRNDITHVITVLTLCIYVLEYMCVHLMDFLLFSSGLIFLFIWFFSAAFFFVHICSFHIEYIYIYRYLCMRGSRSVGRY